MSDEIGPPMSMAELLIRWAAIIILVCFSAMFSGLNLGLMSLDKMGLEIIMGSGSPQQSTYARRIYPIRRRGNLLLCTILLGNVGVNSLLSILMADFTGGLVGFILSTFIIVFIGEIIPQSLCARYALVIGYYTVWIMWIVLIVLLPISFPVAKLLDIFLGREMGTIYSREELKGMMDVYGKHYASDITREESVIVSGALHFGTKTVGEVMTKLEDVYMVALEDRLNYDKIREILEKGYSRIPVYKGKSREDVVGLLFIRDLALVNPNDNMSVKDIISIFGRNLMRVGSSVLLKDMLSEFVAMQSHFALVRESIGTESNPQYRNVGVITLDDVLLQILQTNIIEQSDHLSKLSTRVNPLQDFRAIAGSFANYGAANVNNEDKSAKKQKAFALLSNCKVCCDGLIHPQVIEQLFNGCEMVELEAGAKLYEKGKSTDQSALVLNGVVTVYRKNGQSASSDFRAGSLLAVNCLNDPSWVPDFDAIVTTTPTEVLFIPRINYIAALQASSEDIVVDVEDDF